MDRTLRTRSAEVVRGALGVVYLAGAAVHLAFWATDRGVYAEMTPFVLFDWYRDLWTGLVLPNLAVLLPMLVVFETLVALAVLSKGEAARAGLLAGAAFNLAIAPLGWWWPTNVALAAVHVALLRVAYTETTVEHAGHLFAPRTEAR
jgi:hypothetical protein